MIREDNIRQRVANALAEIQSIRSQRHVITNDQRALALGYFIDSQGVLRKQQKQAFNLGSASATYWPDLPKRVNGRR